MSDQVSTAFVKQYGATVALKVQQMGSKIRECVEHEEMHSEESFFEQVGSTAGQEVTTRHGDSPLNSTPHDRRRCTLRFWDNGDLIDKFDRVRMLIDPESIYVRNAAMAAGRFLDDVILGADASGTGASPIGTYTDGTSGALFGTAFSGKAGTTSNSFDANNLVALNFGGTNVGLTVAKMIEAKRILWSNEVDLDLEELYMAVSATQIANLLNQTPVTSADYNSVRALVDGKVDTFLGYTIKRTQRIPKTGSDWDVPVWVKSGVKLGVGVDIQSEIAKRSDKKFSWYAYVRMGFGGVRMEEAKVAKIRCLA